MLADASPSPDAAEAIRERMANAISREVRPYDPDAPEKVAPEEVRAESGIATDGQIFTSMRVGGRVLAEASIPLVNLDTAPVYATWAVASCWPHRGGIAVRGYRGVESAYLVLDEVNGGYVVGLGRAVYALHVTLGVAKRRARLIHRGLR